MARLRHRVMCRSPEGKSHAAGFSRFSPCRPMIACAHKGSEKTRFGTVDKAEAQGLCSLHPSHIPSRPRPNPWGPGEAWAAQPDFGGDLFTRVSNLTNSHQLASFPSRRRRRHGKDADQNLCFVYCEWGSSKECEFPHRRIPPHPLLSRMNCGSFQFSPRCAHPRLGCTRGSDLRSAKVLPAQRVTGRGFICSSPGITTPPTDPETSQLRRRRVWGHHWV